MSSSESRTHGGITTAANPDTEVGNGESIGKPSTEEGTVSSTGLAGSMMGLPGVVPRQGDLEKSNELFTSQDAGGNKLESLVGIAARDNPPQVPELPADNDGLRSLGLSAMVRDQSDLEQQVAQKYNKFKAENEDKRDEGRIAKAETGKRAHQEKIQQFEARLRTSLDRASSEHLARQVAQLRKEITALDEDIAESRLRIEKRRGETADAAAPDQISGKLANESRREWLIRTGKITPFSKIRERRGGMDNPLTDVMLDAEEGPEDNDTKDVSVDEPLSHQHLRVPGFDQDLGNKGKADNDNLEEPTQKRRRIGTDVEAASAQSSCGMAPVEEKTASMTVVVAGHRQKRTRKTRTHGTNDGSDHDDEEDDVAEDSGSDYESRGKGARGRGTKQRAAEKSTPQAGPSTSKRRKLDRNAAAGSMPALGLSDGEYEDKSDDDEDIGSGRPSKSASVSKKKRSKRKRAVAESNDSGTVDIQDDGNEQLYQARLSEWSHKRSTARENVLRSAQDGTSNMDAIEGDNQEEWLKPHPTKPDTVLEGGLRLPGDIYSALFDYQKTGVRWLWELYQKQVGGIVGDEMGLGKTIQVISFLAALHHSDMLKQPVLVVTPATVMKQWVNEFHQWWPALRVSILHTSGSGMLNVRSEADIEEAIESDTEGPSKHRKGRQAATRIVKTVTEKGHVLITTYAGLQSYGDLLIPTTWGYAVLDEGHKIRNPNASITIYCKEIQTPNRIILSGTPMQNNLIELWSLFDFVYPMRLNTLMNFREQFEVPIKMGGYAKATNLQIRTATMCAEELRNAISPYLLQRLKVDVAADLPKKSEKVLFCSLTPAQRASYEAYLRSTDATSIMKGDRRSFAGIETLRKICNHPDLLARSSMAKTPEYGDPSKSGKMGVVRSLLDLWQKSGHKTLLFAQQRIVLDILEKMVRSMDGILYRRMDGTTPIADRQALVDEFNNSPTLSVFLLTTKVGGLGINLTGADRVIIFDPDWNPSTDSQARERAWRLGQKREVTIFRLMTAGTIEEKIYHRQLFKQFLTNKILKDPQSQQSVPMNAIQDLFTLEPENPAGTETGRIFSEAETRLSRQAIDGQPQPGAPADVGRMAGVASVEDLVNPDEEEARKTGDQTRIVNDILAGCGVSSTLEHDKIVNGKLVVQPDPAMVEKEARRIAAEAVKGLKRAEALAQQVPIGTVTWTGERGSAGRPGRAPGGPASSSSLLAGLQSQPAGGYLTPEALLAKIKAFIVAHGGEVRSGMLVDHFGSMCRTKEQMEQFPVLLRELATLHKSGPMRGTWRLKEEYRR